MMWEERIKELGKSVAIGFILFFSAVMSLMIRTDLVHLELFSKKLSLIVGIYVLGAVVIRWLFSLEIMHRASVFFQGMSMVWWIFLFSFASGISVTVMPAYIHRIVLTNIVVLLCMLSGNYLYMRYIAKEMNRGDWKKGFVLVEDLKCRPKNEDEFMREICEYSRKNALELEIIWYGMPAKIKMGGELYEVKLTEYYNFGGVNYALEFTVVSENDITNS